MLNKRADKLELLRIAEAVALEKSIDKELIISSMETGIAKAAKSKFGQENEIKVSINRDNGDIELFRKLIIAENPENAFRIIHGDFVTTSDGTGIVHTAPTFGADDALVAKQAKLPYSISRLTRDPEYNIKLGSYYFNSLIEDYNGVYPFAIAAYNAGPNRVKTWRRINGDPSKGKLSYVNWIELIRFKETRNYVQRVLENINVYKYMLSKEPVTIDNFFN